jgi:diadenosine hexaphosphate hydrolase (ATP-forming)
MERKHEQSYGVIPVRNEGGEWKVFLIDQYGLRGDTFWGFPKGHPEPGEGAEEAARRELREETALAIERFLPETFTQEYSFMFEGAQIDKYVTYFVGIVAEGDFSIQEEEVKEAGWFTKEEAAKRLTFPRAKEILADAFVALSA